MSNSFFSQPIRRKKDVVIARQRARQIARLLGYSRTEEAAIAAAVFALGANCLTQAGQVTLHFQLRRNTLQVLPEMPEAAHIPIDGAPRWGGWRLERPLPTTGTSLAAEDLAWSMQTMCEFAATNLFEEVENQNDDLLNVLRELNECRAQLAELRERRVQGSAA